MKRTIYKTNWKRIARKGFLPLLPFVAQVGFNTFFLLDGNLNIGEVIFINLLWGILISFPGLLIFINYLTNSINTTVILEYDKLKLKNGDTFIELDNLEIDKIEIHKIRVDNRFPWGFFDYYVFRQGDKKIAFNNFTLEIGDLWRNSLSRRIKNENIEFYYSWYPWMKKSLTKPKLN